MPVTYRCRVCGKALYAYTGNEKTPPGLLSPLEAAARYSYRCPFCGSRVTGELNPDWREHIRVKPRARGVRA